MGGIGKPTLSAQLAQLVASSFERVCVSRHARAVWLEPSSEALAHLELPCGYDAELRADANRVTNRLRALLVTHWPAPRHSRSRA
jgi:hypothetical protein